MKYELIKSSCQDINKLIEYKKKTIFEYATQLSKDELYNIECYVNNNIPNEIDNYYNIIINKEIIGCLSVTNKDDGVLLDEIFLEEKFRNMGIGSDIIKNIISRNNIVYLWVYKLNIKAISLYKKLGFLIVLETDTRYYMKYINDNTF